MYIIWNRYIIHIIHNKLDILVLSLGLGLMLFHDDRPCTIISKHTSILITHIWYWALVWTMCFFMMIDHVISPHPPFSIYRCVYIYVYTPIPNTQYIYIHIYVCIHPNTQYPIPNTKKGHQKIPFLLTSLHNSDLQSCGGHYLFSIVTNWLNLSAAHFQSKINQKSILLLSIDKPFLWMASRGRTSTFVSWRNRGCWCSVTRLGFPPN